MTIFETAKSAVTPKQSAERYGLRGSQNGMATDFGICEAKPSVIAKLKALTTQAENEKLCVWALREYLHILQDWKSRYASQSQGEEPHPQFVEVCHMLECIQYMLDILNCSPVGERASLVTGMMKDGKINLLKARVQEIKEETHA